MKNMTRSDLLLAVNKIHSADFNSLASDLRACYMLNLITKMQDKIEKAYEIVFILEGDKDFDKIGKALRKALES